MIPPWAPHGIALGALNGVSMVAVYGYWIWAHPMGLLWNCMWDFSLVMPWLSSMGRALGFCPSAFYGIALVHLKVSSMEAVL